MFRFADPQYLYLLVLVPTLVLLYIVAAHIRVKSEQRLADKTLFDKLANGRSPQRRHWKFGIALTIFSLLVIMLARPQYGTKSGKETKQGIEVAIMLDVSNSMLAQDVNPDRLQRSKFLVASLIDALKEDQIALGIFAGEAYPQLPLTADHEAAKMFLQSITTGMVTSQGTNLAAAIELADHSFSERKGVGRAIIIITDAEDHEGGATEMAHQVAENGRKVFIMGVGSTSGTHIPTYMGDMIDQEGHTVISRLNEELAREVATSGKGLYLHIDDSDAAQKALLEELGQMQKISVSEEYTERNEQFQAFGILALFLIILDFFIFERKNPLIQRLHLFNRQKNQNLQ